MLPHSHITRINHVSVQTEYENSPPAPQSSSIVTVAQAHMPFLQVLPERASPITSPAVSIEAIEYKVARASLYPTCTALTQVSTPFSTISRGDSTSSSSSSLRTSPNLPTITSSLTTSLIEVKSSDCAPSVDIKELASTLPDMSVVLLQMIYDYCYMVTSWSSPGKVSLTILPKRETLDMDIRTGMTVAQFVSDICAKLKELGHTHHDKRFINIYDDADKTFKILSSFSTETGMVTGEPNSVNPILEHSVLYVIPHRDLILQFSEDSELHCSIKIFRPGAIKDALFDCNPDCIEPVEAYIRDIWQRFTNLDASLAICQHNIEAINEKLRLLAGLVRLDQRITDTPLYIANNSSPTATEPHYSLTSGRVAAKDIINRLPNDLILHTFSYLDFRSQLHMCAISKNIPNLIRCKSKLITMSPSMLIHKALSYRKETFSYREEVMQFSFSAVHNAKINGHIRKIRDDIRPAQENLKTFGEALKTALMEDNWETVCVLLKQVIAFTEDPAVEPVIPASVPKTGDQIKWKSECLLLCPQLNQGAWPAMLALLSRNPDDNFELALLLENDTEEILYVSTNTTPILLRMHFFEKNACDIALFHRGSPLEMNKTLGNHGVDLNSMLTGYRVTSSNRHQLSKLTGYRLTSSNRHQLSKIEVTRKLLKQYELFKEFTSGTPYV